MRRVPEAGLSGSRPPNHFEAVCARVLQRKEELRFQDAGRWGQTSLSTISFLWERASRTFRERGAVGWVIVEPRPGIVLARPSVMKSARFRPVNAPLLGVRWIGADGVPVR